MEELQKELEYAKAKGLFREMKIISSAPEKEIVFNGKKYLNFSSNNYLNLATDPEVKKAAIEAIQKYGAGGTSSRLVAGTLDIHLQLEQKLASFKHTQSALVFPTGFQTNAGVISTLVKDGDCIIMDRLNHASLWDGAKLSGARIFIYQHKDLNALEKVLKRASEYRRRLIVTDTVFSMDGDLAPLKEIVTLAKKYNAWTFVDEAHATGIFGKNGSGLCEYFGVEKDVDVIMGTLSKALGSQGGFVCGKKELIDYLVNFCRSFIYTTSLSPSSCAAALKSIELIEKDPERRRNLLDRAKNLRKGLNDKGFDTGASESQIIPLMAGSVEKAMALSKKFFENGIFAPAIRPPTVPENECRIRFSLMSSHSDEDLDKLLNVL
ncbi:MAG: 8-amino-7-oxononanoate synthase [Elusimicrobia bacterium]|nr:8-amino-7-oxononanoate synthase [Elusimicrobiota bacterium]